MPFHLITILILYFQIPVHCRRDLDILITVTDSNGRKFDNFSSLVFDWTLSDQSLASFSDSIASSVETVHGIKLVNSKYRSMNAIAFLGCLGRLYDDVNLNKLNIYKQKI